MCKRLCKQLVGICGIDLDMSVFIDKAFPVRGCANVYHSECGGVFRNHLDNG